LTSIIADQPSTSRSQQHRPQRALTLWFERVAAYARIKRDVFAAVEVCLTCASAGSPWTISRPPARGFALLV
jgi:hypothetical protein